MEANKQTGSPEKDFVRPKNPPMSRRSSRLVSGGYYNSDEESDSSSVTNISYRENPVKVFKKKAGTRKSGSRTSSRANSNDSSPGTESPVTAGPGPSPLTQMQSTTRTVSYISPVVTPRPAVTPSSSRSQTPTRSTPVPPEKSHYAGLSSSNRLGLHLRANHKEPNQSSIDSSGYSSSEGPYKKPTTPITPTSTTIPTSTTSKINRNSAVPISGYRNKMRSAFFNLMDSTSLMAAAAQSKITNLTTLANNPSFSSRAKKAFGLLLLLLLIILCVWFLLPLLAPYISRMAITKSQTHTKPVTADPVPPAPRPYIVPPTHVVDPAVVSAAVEAKMQRLQEELQLKHELLLSEMKQGIDVDLQGMKAKLEAVGSDSRLRLDEEVAGLQRQITAYQTESHSAANSLRLKIQALEAQNTKLSQELTSIQLVPPPAPCPEPSTGPILTPELQQAMEKWLTDYIREQDALRLGGGGCTDCRRPMADKMPDFALETQGASVVSTRCSETYRIRSACVTLFGFPLWYPSESPRTVIQGYPVLLPGKCWAFHGVQGTLVISLSHPIRITHVTLDHLPRYISPTGRIDSATKDFEVYGMKEEDEEKGALLGTFTYDERGESTQTFKLPNPSDEVYRFVELRVLSNWGHVEYTCIYRFRVHGEIIST